MTIMGTNPLKTIMDILTPNGWSLGRVDDARKAKEIVEALVAQGWAPPEVVGATVVEAGGRIKISDRQMLETYEIQTFVQVDPPAYIIQARVAPETIQGTVDRPAIGLVE